MGGDQERRDGDRQAHTHTGVNRHTQGRDERTRDRKARGKGPGGSQKGFVRLEEVPSSPKDPSF